MDIREQAKALKLRAEHAAAFIRLDDMDEVRVQSFAQKMSRCVGGGSNWEEGDGLIMDMMKAELEKLLPEIIERMKVICAEKMK